MRKISILCTADYDVVGHKADLVARCDGYLDATVEIRNISTRGNNQLDQIASHFVQTNDAPHVIVWLTAPSSVENAQSLKFKLENLTRGKKIIPMASSRAVLEGKQLTQSDDQSHKNTWAENTPSVFQHVLQRLKSSPKHVLFVLNPRQRQLWNTFNDRNSEKLDFDNDDHGTLLQVIYDIKTWKNFDSSVPLLSVERFVPALKEYIKPLPTPSGM